MDTHQKIMARMENFKLAMGDKVVLPPPTLVELGAKFIDFEAGKSLTIEVPFQARFTNPVGSYQGGMFAAALDEAFGPLSYMTAELPCVTLDMSLTYIKGLVEKDAPMKIRAEVLKKTSQFIFMRAEIRNRHDEILVIAQSHSTIIQVKS